MKRRNLVMHTDALYDVPKGVPHLVLAENKHGFLIQIRFGCRYVGLFHDFHIEYLG